jgi:mono/diheme cytochrome c family protein
MRYIIFTVLTIGLMSFVYAGGKHGGGHGQNAHWMSPEKESARVNPIKRDKDSIARGAALYEKNCAACHGAKARGDGPAGKALNPKPADLKKMSGGHPDGDFAWKISIGRGAMPGWKGSLSENQIWDLVNYIQSLSATKGHGMTKGHKGHGKKNKHKHGHSH